MRLKDIMVGTVLIATGTFASASLGYAAKVASPVRLQEAVKRTVASKSLAFGVSIKMDIKATGQSISGTIAGTGLSDLVNKSSSFTMDMGPFMKAIAKQGGQPLPPQFSDPAILILKTVSIGPKVWMSYPVLSAISKTDASKPWILLDVAKLGVDAGDLAASQGVDPSQGLEMLVGLSSSANLVGGEILDGVPTIKFDSVLTWDSLTKNLPASQAAEIKKMMGAETTIPASVWLDEQNRVRRLDVTFKINQAGAKMNLASSYTFSKFNEPVSIVPPAASQVDAKSPLIDLIAKAAKAKKLGA